jgi:hypothetical protein
MTKHVQIRMKDADYMRLRVLCALRGCSQQELLMEIIRSYIQSAPEMKPRKEGK